MADTRATGVAQKQPGSFSWSCFEPVPINLNMWCSYRLKFLRFGCIIFSCPQQLNRWPCPLLGPSDQTNNQSSQHYRVTLETCDLSDIWSDFLMTIFDDNFDQTFWWQFLWTTTRGLPVKSLLKNNYNWIKSWAIILLMLFMRFN